jgi:hypothetical protein
LVEREFADSNLADDRLNMPLRELLAQIGITIKKNIPILCQDWANAKAAYRPFLQ